LPKCPAYDLGFLTHGKGCVKPIHHPLGDLPVIFSRTSRRLKTDQEIHDDIPIADGGTRNVVGIVTQSPRPLNTRSTFSSLPTVAVYEYAARQVSSIPKLGLNNLVCRYPAKQY
jgi:hypothetical protein